MNAPKIPPPASPHAPFQISWPRDGLLEVTLHGVVTAGNAERLMVQITALTAHTRLDSVLVDLSEVEGYTSQVGSPAERLFTLVREQGARKVVFVARSTAARMMTASVAFAAQLPMKMYETRAEALAYLRGTGG